jgi:hypothetical protein
MFDIDHIHGAAEFAVPIRLTLQPRVNRRRHADDAFKSLARALSRRGHRLTHCFAAGLIVPSAGVTVAQCRSDIAAHVVNDDRLKEVAFFREASVRDLLAIPRDGIEDPRQRLPAELHVHVADVCLMALGAARQALRKHGLPTRAVDREIGMWRLAPSVLLDAEGDE